MSASGNTEIQDLMMNSKFPKKEEERYKENSYSFSIEKSLLQSF